MINNERVLIVFARIISNCRLKLRKLRRGKVLLLLKGENSTILWLSRNCRAGERQRERKGSRKILAFLLLRLIINAPLVFPPSVCYHNIFKAERKLLRSSLSSGRWLKPMHQIPNSKTDTLKTTSGTKKKKWGRREWRFRIYSRDKSEMSAGMDLCVTFCSSFSFRARASNIFALPIPPSFPLDHFLMAYEHSYLLQLRASLCSIYWCTFRTIRNFPPILLSTLTSSEPGIYI